jgi:hypothetical protein
MLTCCLVLQRSYSTPNNSVQRYSIFQILDEDIFPQQASPAGVFPNSYLIPRTHILRLLPRLTSPLLSTPVPLLPHNPQLEQARLVIGLSWLDQLLSPTTPLCCRWPREKQVPRRRCALSHHSFRTTSNSNRLDTPSVCTIDAPTLVN